MCNQSKALSSYTNNDDWQWLKSVPPSMNEDCRCLTLFVQSLLILEGSSASSALYVLLTETGHQHPSRWFSDICSIATSKLGLHPSRRISISLHFLSIHSFPFLSTEVFLIEMVGEQLWLCSLRARGSAVGGRLSLGERLTMTLAQVSCTK